jgi:transposase-like protein
MTRIARKSDGRRIFTTQFRREQIGRVLRGELTLAELSRKRGIARALLQRWKRLETQGAGAAVRSDGAGSIRALQVADQRIGELQRLVGKQTVELENLRVELSTLRSRRRA